MRSYYWQIGLLVLSLLIYPYVAIAQSYHLTPTLSHQIDGLVEGLMEHRHIPGLTLAVLVDGHPFFLKGYGVSDVKTGEPIALRTLFGLGSVSKVLTAFGVMLLVQDRKIDLDDSIKKYLPEAPATWQAVTIRQLLSHMSGIHPYQDRYFPWSRTWRQLANASLDFTPGTQIKYNNFGFIVLGRLIEVVSKQPYEQFMQSQIFRPLGMSHTSIPSVSFPPGLAKGYKFDDNQLQETSNSIPWNRRWSSGGIVTDIIDMAHWDAALTEKALLAPWNYQLMWTPVELNDGEKSRWTLGWHVTQSDGETIVDKNGGIAGYSSWIERHLEDRISVIILCNLTSAHGLHRLAQAIVDRIKVENQLSFGYARPKSVSGNS